MEMSNQFGYLAVLTPE